MFKNILAVVAGLLAGMLSISAMEYIGHQIYPPPVLAADASPEMIRNIAMTMPEGALLLIALAWAIGSLVGGFVAARIAGHPGMPKAFTVGGVLMFFGIINIVIIPHPAWFIGVALFSFLPFSYFGAVLARKSRKE